MSTLCCAAQYTCSSGGGFLHSDTPLPACLGTLVRLLLDAPLTLYPSPPPSPPPDVMADPPPLSPPALSAPPQTASGADMSVASTAGSILSTPPPVLPTVAAAHPLAAAELPPGAAAVAPPTPLPAAPPPLSALTLRLVKSFSHRNVALIVLLDVNLATTGLTELLARVRARVAVDESGALLPYTTAAAKADTGRVHVAGAHAAKDGGLTVAGGDEFIPPGVPLADLGVTHEGEVTLFNRLEYEEFLASGSPMIW